MKKSVIILVLILVLAIGLSLLVACEVKDAEGRIVLKTPLNVKINADSDTVTWDEVTGRTQYEIEVSKDGEIIKTEKTSTANYTFSAESDGTYKLRIRALGDGVEYSLEGEWTELEYVYSKTNRLKTPLNLKFDETTKVLSWDKVENATAYQVLHSRDNFVIDVTGGATSASLAERISSDPYYHNMKVRAISGDDKYFDSNWTTPGYNYLVTGTLSFPAHETNRKGTLKLTGSSGSEYLSWDKVENATRYIMKAVPVDASDAPIPGGTTYTYPSTIQDDAPSRALSNLQIARAGKYKITVTAEAGSYLYPKSIESDAVYVTKLAPIADDSFRMHNYFDGTEHKAFLEWDALAGDIVALQIMAKKVGSSGTSFYEKITTSDSVFSDKEISLLPAVASEKTMYSHWSSASSSYAGRVFDFYVKAVGTGSATDGLSAELDSAETRAVTVDGTSTKDNKNMGYYTYVVPKTDTADTSIYLITTAGELAYAHYFPDKNYRLQNKLNLNNDEIYPIGGLGSDPSAGATSDDKMFTGTFDGQGYPIYNFKITNYYAKGDFKAVDYDAARPSNLNQPEYATVGFFGAIGAGATVKNLQLLNVTVSTPVGYAVSYAGILTGYSAGTIETCDVSGSVSANGFAYVGGVVGYSEGDMSFSTASLTGAVSGKYYTGGFAGFLKDVEIKSCSVYFATISAYVTVDDSDGSAYVGGFAGYAENTVFSLSFAKGDSSVTATHDKIGAGNGTFAGGFIGRAVNSDFEKCYAEAKVAVYRGDDGAKNLVGGFVAFLESGSSLSGSYAIATLEGNGQNGGLIGEIDSTSTVDNAYASSMTYVGSVPLPNGLFIAVLGCSESNITNSFYNVVRGVPKDLNGKSLVSGIGFGGTDGEIASAKMVAPGDMTLDENVFAYATFNLNGGTVTLPILKDMLYLDNYGNRNRTLSKDTKPADGAEGVNDFYGRAYHAGKSGNDKVVSIDNKEKYSDYLTGSPYKFTVSYVIKDSNTGDIIMRITRFMTV